jgi:hypothetical protein
LLYQSSFPFISQTGVDIRQNLILSAKLVHLSAKTPFFQPIWCTYQPISGFFSQSGRLSANLRFFQPNWCTYQPISGFFSQTGALISQNLIFSAKPLSIE